VDGAEPDRPRRGSRAWLLVLAAWTLVGLMRGANRTLTVRLTGAVLDPRTTPFFDPLLSAWVWALLTPLAAAVCRKFPFEPGRRRRAVLAQLAAAPLLATAHAAIVQPLMVLVKIGTLETAVHGANTVSNLVANLPTLLGIAWGLAAVLYSVESLRRSREAALRAATLNAEVSLARLDALTRRVDLERVLQRLDELSALIPSDPAAAEDAVVALGTSLRSAAGGAEDSVSSGGGGGTERAPTGSSATA